MTILYFNTPLGYIILIGNSFGSVYLHQNNLTRFESYVFQTMLEGMVKDGFGSLSLYESNASFDLIICMRSFCFIH